MARPRRDEGEAAGTIAELALGERPRRLEAMMQRTLLGCALATWLAALGCSEPTSEGPGLVTTTATSTSSSTAGSGGAGGQGSLSGSGGAGGAEPEFGPGTITITTSELAGYEGMKFVAVAMDMEGQHAAKCETISGTTFTGTLGAMLGRDPCNSGEPAKLEPGTYYVHVTIFSADMLQQLACQPAYVEVNGDVTATLPPPMPCM